MSRLGIGAVALIGAILISGRSYSDPPQPPVPPPTETPAVQAPPVTPPAPPKQEDSPTYISGYSDGCASANLRYARQEHVKPARDPKLYEGDPDYRAGWDHGYRKCEDKITPGGLSVPGNSVVL